MSSKVKLCTRDEARFCLMGFCINPEYMSLNKETLTATLKPGKSIFGYGVFKNKTTKKSSFYVGVPGSANGWFQRVMWKRVELHENIGKKEKGLSLFNLHMIADMGNNIEVTVVISVNAFFAVCLNKIIKKKPDYQLEFRFIENGSDDGSFLATPSVRPFMKLKPIVFDKDFSIEKFAP